MPHDEGAHAHDHPHPGTPDHPEPDPDIAVMEQALRELLIEKGVFSAVELQRAIEAMERRSHATGAAVVARAWVDPGFRDQLMTHANSAVASFGVTMGVAELTAIENTPDCHNLVVCTLCSCYPRALLGIPPKWYKTKSYRARAVLEPRAVLAEFGLVLPQATRVRVHDSTADLRFIVVPERPPGTDGWSEERLARLVTCDSLIGVSRALDPSELREHPAPSA